MGNHIDNILLLCIAALNAYSVYISHRTGRQIKDLEINTNSNMDKLVRTTRSDAQQSGFSAGQAQERSDQRDRDRDRE